MVKDCSPEERFGQLGLELPPSPVPIGSYVLATEAPGLVFVSGQTSIVNDELKYRGKVGGELSIEDGYLAAQLCALRCLAVLASTVGDLSRVERILKVTGYVNSVSGFADHGKVVDGASELLEKVFGDRGKHARVSIGVAGLPGDAAVEVELIALLG